jgi:hypothetical protein
VSASGDAWRRIIRNSAVLAAAVLTGDWNTLRPQYVLTDFDTTAAVLDTSAVATATRVNTILWFIDLLAGHGLPVDLRATILLADRPELSRTLYSAGPKYAADLMAAGMPPDQAMRKGYDRLALAAGNYMDAVSKDELQRVMGENNSYVQGYRREAKPSACGFCRILAARTNPALVGSVIFNVTEKWAKPHPNCRCVLLPQPIFRVIRTLSRDEKAAVRDLKADLLAQRDAALSGINERRQVA